MNAVGSDKRDIKIQVFHLLDGSASGDRLGRPVQFSTKHDRIDILSSQHGDMRHTWRYNRDVAGVDKVKHFKGSTAGIDEYHLIVFDHFGCEVTDLSFLMRIEF